MKIFTLLLLLSALVFANDTSIQKFDLGMNYLLGKGVKQNKKTAFKYLQESAQMGNKQAQYNLALMYYLGDGVKQDTTKTLLLLEESAKQGYQKAIENIGRVAMQIMKFDKALYWLKINAKNGDIKANYLIAEIYIAQDDLKNAKVYAQKAINSGDKDAKLLWEEYKLSSF
jgi:hypothetical protein